MELIEIEQRVKRILTDRLGMAPNEIRLEARLVDDLGTDSLDAVELTIAAEREFDVVIGDDQMAKLATVGDVVDLVTRLMRGISGNGGSAS